MSIKANRILWEWLAPVGLGVAMLGAAVVLTPLPQNPEYHHFADARTLLGIPHFWNVITNLPFLILGLAGMIGISQGRLVLDEGTRLTYFLAFLGIALTGFGSAYYHLDPTNERLLWDRLPMTLAFMSLFSAALGERTRPVVSQVVLAPLLLLGVGSVLYWHFGEQQGAGNLRPYLAMQFYPLGCIPLLLLMTTPRFTRGYDFPLALGWYVLAKVLEQRDARLYEWLGQIGGHPLKHLAAAMGAFWLLRMLRLRKTLAR